MQTQDQDRSSTGIAFDDADWSRIATDWSAWWDHQLGRPIVLLEGWSEAAEKLPRTPHFVAQLPLEMDAETVLDRYHAQLTRGRWYGDAFPKWWLNFGPGIVAGFLGAGVEVDPNTVWFTPRPESSIADLQPSFDRDNRWWRRITELSAAAGRRWQGQVAVGHTDLGGNLDILASLRSSEGLLMDVLDEPEEVARCAAAITRIWMECYDVQDALIRGPAPGTTPWAAIWSPRRCYMLQCDFAYMISPAMFERFVIPDLSACCEQLDHGFYHLDGKGQLPHLDLLLELPRLRGIQWIPGDGQPPPWEWPEVLGRIKAAGKLCQLYVTPEGALRVVREHGGRGFVLAVGGNFEAEDAQAFLRELQAADRDPW